MADVRATGGAGPVKAPFIYFGGKRRVAAPAWRYGRDDSERHADWRLLTEAAGHHSLAAWNDAPGRTFAEVEAVVLEAIAAIQEAEA